MMVLNYYNNKDDQKMVSTNRGHAAAVLTEITFCRLSKKARE